MTSKLRIVTTMMGDYSKNPIVYKKHRGLFEALSKRYRVEGIFDASLKGISRLVNAVSVVTPDQLQWRERFYKNPTAFRQRSKRAIAFLRSMQDKADFALQIGAMFDGIGDQAYLPCIIYSDYTSMLSSRKPQAGRSPFFTTKEREEWLALETSALHHATHICTRSHLVRDSLIQDYGLSPGKITVIGGGLNLYSLPEIEATHHSEAPLVLFIGKDFHRKGGDLLLKAFAKVRSVIPSAKLTMVTSATIPKEYSLDNVEVIDRFCDQERLAELYRSADIFVLPSRLETWGDVLLEAMAFALPCIGVRGDAMDEIIEHGQDGFLFPPEDVDSLTDKLLTLMQNADLPTSFGSAARTKIESGFLWDHVVQRMVPVIESVSNKPAPASCHHLRGIISAL